MPINENKSKLLSKLPILESGVEIFAVTDTGLVRKNNEDRYLVGFEVSEGESSLSEILNLSFKNDNIFFMVSDGMGGQAAGEVASLIASNTVKNTFKGFEKGNEPFPKTESEYIDLIIHSLVKADNAIKEATLKDESLRCMGATATLAGFYENRLYIGQVGDSRAYLVRDGAATLVTKDQSFVQKLLEEGAISEEEADIHPHRNIILQALGARVNSLRVSITSVDICLDDYIILCSDGLSGMLSSDQMSEIVNSSDSLYDISKKLVDTANENGGKDNITVVLAHIIDKDLAHPANSSVDLKRIISYFS